MRTLTKAVLLVGALFSALSSASLVAAASTHDCGDRKVSEAYANNFICVSLFHCEDFGIKDYTELMNLTPEQIRDRFSHSPYRERTSKAQVHPNFRAYGQQVFLEAMLAARQLGLRVELSPIDYNTRVGLYTCHSAMYFDLTYWTPVIKGALFNKTFDDPYTSAVYAATEQKGEDPTRYFRIALETNAAAAVSRVQMPINTKLMVWANPDSPNGFSFRDEVPR